MSALLKTVAVLSALAGSALGHGYVSGIVADGVYTEGWQVSFFYDIENGVTIPQTPGWYEEALDLGFVPPDQYQYVLFIKLPPSFQAQLHVAWPVL